MAKEKREGLIRRNGTPEGWPDGAQGHTGRGRVANCTFAAAFFKSIPISLRNATRWRKRPPMPDRNAKWKLIARARNEPALVSAKVIARVINCNCIPRARKIAGSWVSGIFVQESQEWYDVHDVRQNRFIFVPIVNNIRIRIYKGREKQTNKDINRKRKYVKMNA